MKLQSLYTARLVAGHESTGQQNPVELTFEPKQFACYS